MEYKLMPRVSYENKDVVTKMFANAQWDSIPLLHFTNKTSLMFRCIIYSLHELTKDGNKPYQGEVKQWIKEHSEELSDRIIFVFINKYGKELDDISKSVMINRIKKYVAQLPAPEFCCAFNYARLTGLLNRKITPHGKHYVHTYTWDEKGKKACMYLNQGYLF